MLTVKPKEGALRGILSHCTLDILYFCTLGIYCQLKFLNSKSGNHCLYNVLSAWMRKELEKTETMTIFHVAYMKITIVKRAERVAS